MSRYPRLPLPPLGEAEQIPIKRAFKELLQVSPAFGYQLIRDKKLKTHMLGARRYTTRANIRHCVKLLEAESR